MAHDHLTRSALARQIGRDRATLWRWERTGVIPPAQRVAYKAAVYSPEAQRAIRAYAEHAL